MPNLTPEIIELLQKVKTHILEVPSRLIMDDWLQKLTPGNLYIDTYVKNGLKQIVPDCGTVGCIKGWMNKLSPKTQIPFILDDLFFPNHWPEEMWEKYENSSSVEEKAQIAADMIDFAIKTDATW